MGSGKSSVVDAICYALYGTYPKLMRRDAKLSDVKNFRHLQKACYVQIEWESEQKQVLHTFCIKREVEPTSATLYVDKKVVCKGAKAVTEQVEQILQIPYELFARAVYSEQNKLDYWLTLSSAQRKAEIDRLLGLDKFELVRSRAGSEVNKIREQATQIESDVSIEKISQIKEHIQKWSNQIEKTQKNIDELAVSLKQIQIQKDDSEKEFLQIDKQSKEFKLLNDNLNLINGKIESLQKNISQTKIIVSKQELEKLNSQYCDELKSISVKINQMDLNLRHIISEISQTKSKILDSEKKSKRKKQLQDDYSKLGIGATIQKNMDDLKLDLQNIREKKSVLSSKISELEKILIAFDAGLHDSAKCPMCDSIIDAQNFSRVKSSKKDELQKCKSSLSELSAQLIRKEKEHDSILVKLESLNKIQIQILEIGEICEISVLESKLKKLHLDQERLVADIEKLREQSKALIQKSQQTKSDIEKCNLVQKWNEEVLSSKESAKQITDKMQSLEFSEQKYTQAFKKVEKLKSDTLLYEQKIASNKESLLQTTQIFNQEQKMLYELEKKRNIAKTLREKSDELVKFKEVVIATQLQLRESLIENINLAMQKIWPIIYPYSDWSSVRLLADEKDYSIQIYQSEWKDLEAHASGGERACLGLCLRTAMSVVLTPHLGWLILDEPTHNLDENAVRALGESISISMPKIIPQILVITHDSKLLENTHSRVFKFERNKSIGEDTQVVV